MKGGTTISTMNLDYQQEINRLKENESLGASDYWRPDIGQYKVKAISEIEDGRPFEEEGKEPQLRKQIHLMVTDKGVEKEVVWTMPFGLTPASLYGQLVFLGSVKGKLKDTNFTVVVTGTGKNKRSTIVA